MKYTKIEQMVHEMLLTEDKAIPRIASSKSSDQKNSNWDFDLEISQLGKKVFMPTSKM